MVKLKVLFSSKNQLKLLFNENGTLKKGKYLCVYVSAYESCAVDPYCATSTMFNYMSRYAQVS